ncbi:hypothetical protein BST12_24790 [Mycobacterium angelicum]|uniref:Uncharacterized protein n=1 Tax=Mycobacterium angelicum TaxID=470074 RepID=A0A1W9ZDX4_MYCAN|nr:hypothetical protein BST12_24790 [Mycobacterium angelicum]
MVSWTTIRVQVHQQRRLQDEEMLSTREKILVEGLDDWVKVAQVHDYVAFENPSATLSDVQRRTLELIRSMADEGVIALGELKEGGARFVSWDIPVDHAIKRLAAEYVERFDDSTGWPWTLWFAVTDKGKQIAQSCQGEYASWLECLRAQGREYEAIPPQLAPGGRHET